MLCFRCGSHVNDGAEQCWNCGADLSQRKKAPTSELRARPRSGSRIFGVVYKIGDLIADRYRVRDIVGSGGAGVVYRAQDREVDVDVAVKVINGKLVQTPEERRLLSRQTKIAKKLNHQNCVRIYDDGMDEERPFFCMQFLEGLSLRRIIDLRREKGQVFSGPEVEPIFNQLCQGLDYAHRTTFHGNLKPDNVLVLPDLLKVTDFALLRGLPRKPFLALQKSRGHNFRYLAPEVRLEVAELDKAVDVFSLGVILLEMLTGHVFEDGQSEPAEAALSDLHPALASLVRQCLMRMPNDRISSALEVHKQLREAVRVAAADAPLKNGASSPPATSASAAASAGSAPAVTSDASSSSGAKNEEPETPVVSVDLERPRAAHAAPTERLDVERHGPRPTPADPAEGSGPEPSITFPIEEHMIEAEATAQSQEVAAEPTRMVRSPSEAAGDEEDLIDNPAPLTADLGEDDETMALEEPSQGINALRARIEVSPDPTIVDSDLRPSKLGSLQEISNSAIELIADPKATDVVRVGRKNSGPSSVPDGSHAHPPPANAEAEPTRADPPPALSDVQALDDEPIEIDVAHEDTRHGDLALRLPPFEVKSGRRPSTRPRRGPSSRAAAASSPVLVDTKTAPRPSPNISEVPTPEVATHLSNGSVPAGVASVPSAGSRSRPKARPMTRPRLAAVAPAGPTPVVVSPSARPAPATDPARRGGDERGPTVLPVAEGSNRLVYFTVAASFLIVLAAFLVVVKITTDQQRQNQAEIAALRAQILREDRRAASARSEAQAALEEANRLAQAGVRAERAAQTAERALARSTRAKAEAERVAQAEEATARRLRARAKAEADENAKKLAERRAAEAAALAKQKRADADNEARRIQAEQKKKAEAEAARARQDKARRAAEQRAEERRAEERQAAARAAELRAARRTQAESRDDSATARRRPLIRDESLAEGAAGPKGPGPGTRAIAAAATAARLAPEPEEGRCPRGMKLIEGGSFMMGSLPNDPERNFGDLPYEAVEVPSVCMDYYEYPNGRGRQPSTKVTWKTAAARCERRGKRLCTEAEWEKACKGPGGYRYAYGNQWDPERCNTEDEEGNDREPSASGSFARCRSRFGIIDMPGNVAEWTSTAQGRKYVLKGGGADRPGYDSRCAARSRKNPTFSSERLGFRCCRDPLK